MKLLVFLLLLASTAFSQSFPLEKKDTLSITYRDSLVTTTITQTYKVPVFTVKPYVTPPVVVDPPPVVVPPSTGIIPSTARLLFSENFSNGWGVMRPTQIKRGTVVTSPNGTPAFRAQVLAGDAATSNGYRDEILPPSSATDNGEMWYQYDVYYNVLGQGGGGHSMQWHPGNSSGSATLALYTDYGNFNVVRSIGGGNYYQPGTLKPIVLKKWYKLIWHIKWSTGSDGIIELFIDGEKYFTYKGQTMESVGVYAKYGANRWLVSNTWDIYYDNISTYKK